MHANDNLTTPLTPAMRLAVDWACTIPGEVSLVRHPQFGRYFGGLTRDEIAACAEEMRIRVAAALSEVRLLEGARAASKGD